MIIIWELWELNLPSNDIYKRVANLATLFKFFKPQVLIFNFHIQVAYKIL